MARPGEFVDPDYDKRLAAFKAMRDEQRREMAAEKKASEPVKGRAPINGNNNTIRRY